MKIKMIKTSRASLDGINITTFKEGCIYEKGEKLTQEIIESFFDDGVCEIVEEHKPEEKKVVKPKESKKSAKKKKVQQKDG
jgi:hypothetical protein